MQDRQRGVKPQPAPVADEVRASLQRDAILMLLGLHDGKLSATRLPDVSEGGRALPAIEVTSRAMAPVSVLFDPGTTLISGLRYTDAARGGAKVEEAFSDYRDVNGLKVAFRATVSRDGTPFLRRVVHRFESNVPLDATLFTRPG